MKKVNVLMAVIYVLVTLPIWLYLLYQILVRVQASELMWFLYWVYLPVVVVVAVVQQAIKEGQP